MALKKAKKKIGLTTKIFIALIAGAILGIILFNLPAGSVRDDIVIDGNRRYKKTWFSRR